MFIFGRKVRYDERYIHREESTSYDSYEGNTRKIHVGGWTVVEEKKDGASVEVIMADQKKQWIKVNVRVKDKCLCLTIDRLTSSVFSSLLATK